MSTATTATPSAATPISTQLPDLTGPVTRRQRRLVLFRPSRLLELPSDCLNTVVTTLPVADVVSLIEACRQLRHTIHSDGATRAMALRQPTEPASPYAAAHALLRQVHVAAGAEPSQDWLSLFGRFVRATRAEPRPTDSPERLLPLRCTEKPQYLFHFHVRYKAKLLVCKTCTFEQLRPAGGHALDLQPDPDAMVVMEEGRGEVPSLPSSLCQVAKLAGAGPGRFDARKGHLEVSAYVTRGYSAAKLFACGPMDKGEVVDGTAGRVDTEFVFDEVQLVYNCRVRRTGSGGEEEGALLWDLVALPQLLFTDLIVSDATPRHCVAMRLAVHFLYSSDPADPDRHVLTSTSDDELLQVLDTLLHRAA